MDKKSILLVDDHKMVRDGIKAMLEDELHYQVVAEADSGKKALELLKEVTVDLIIMDISMPDMDGIASTKEIKSHYQDAHILILTMLNEEQHIRTLVEAGAKGYILKNSGKEELLKAIEAILQGDNYFSEAVARVIMMDLVNRNQPKNLKKEYIPVTDRELEVLALIIKEYTNQEIADQLCLSVRTVDTHRRNLLEKTGVRNTAGLVKFALQHHLLKDRL
jgi:DNA-binding NarL/FixJ family response regulator